MMLILGGHMPEGHSEKRIERELTGEPVQAGEYTLRPVAHASVTRDQHADESYGVMGAYVRLAPVAMIVEGADGMARRIAITDPTDRAIDALGRVGLLVAAVSLAAMVIRKLTR
jgi:hypothetical protein